MRSLLVALQVFTSPAFLAHESPGHLERPDRLRAAEAALRGSGLPLEWRDARPASQEELLGGHTQSHLARVAAACAQGAWLDPDTYTSPASLDAALRAAGGAIDAAASALRGEPAISLGRPPGHHAEAARAMGFCLFGNVALAAASLAPRRVAIVDVDVHHGNGTQHLVAERAHVHFSSLHGWPLYPGTGRVEETGPRGNLLNLPVPAGTGHEGWLEAFDAAVVPALERFRPEVILVSAGYDAHWRDPIGNCQLVAQSYHAAIERLRAIQPRIAAVLEGGYDLDALGAGVAATAAAMLGERAPRVEDVPAGARPWPELAARVAAAHPELGL